MQISRRFSSVRSLQSPTELFPLSQSQIQSHNFSSNSPTKTVSSAIRIQKRKCTNLASFVCGEVSIGFVPSIFGSQRSESAEFPPHIVRCWELEALKRGEVALQKSTGWRWRNGSCALSNRIGE